MCLPIGSVILCAVILAVYGGVGVVHPVGTFGRFVAPYCLFAAVAMGIALLVGYAIELLEAGITKH